MRGLWFKLGLFLVLWYEVAAELRLDGDGSFLVAVLIIGMLWFGLRLAGQLLGMLGPNVQRFIVGLLAWLVLYWWFAPGALKALPLIYVLIGAGLLAIGTARIRHRLERYRPRLMRLRQHPRARWVIAGVCLTFALALGGLHEAGYLWTLIGQALLPGLPVVFGWHMAGTVGAARADAQFGDPRGFRDAGLSEDR